MLCSDPLKVETIAQSRMNNISVTDQIALNLFISKNNSRFLVTSEVQCGLQSVKHCPSMLAEKTNHGAFADTISCPSEDGPLSNKFQI